MPRQKQPSTRHNPDLHVNAGNSSNDTYMHNNPQFTEEHQYEEIIAESKYETLEGQSEDVDRYQHLKRDKIDAQKLPRSLRGATSEDRRTPKKCCRFRYLCGCLGIFLGLGLLGVIVTSIVFFLSGKEVNQTKLNGTIVEQLPIEHGPLAVKSLCKLQVGRFIERRTFEESTDIIEHPAQITTANECLDVCLGPKGDGVLTTGQNCLGAEFINGKCRIVTTIRALRTRTTTVKDSIRYSLTTLCSSAKFPEVMYEFYRLHNRQPRPRRGVQTHLLSSGQSYPDCYDQCLLKHVGVPNSCYQFLFDVRENSCTFDISRGYSYEVAEGKTLFQRFLSTIIISCRNAVQDVYLNRTDPQAKISYGLSLSLCRDRCITRYYMSDVCYGFEYNHANKSCHMSTNKNYRLIPFANAMYNKVKMTCYSRGCDRRTQFISMKDTSVSKGTTSIIPQGNDDKISQRSYCVKECLQNAPINSNETCYGFSVNYNKKTCTLYYNFDHPLGVVGGSPGIDQFRRILYCNASCKEAYIKYSNTGSSGGILQPKDINTFALCAARCIDYFIATELTCYGFDFNRNTGECTIYIQQDYVFTARKDVDNYKRSKTCDLPY